MKFCKDCIYQKNFIECHHPEAYKSTNLIGGFDNYKTCGEFREEDEKCGPEGKLWKPKFLHWVKEWIRRCFTRRAVV